MTKRQVEDYLQDILDAVAARVSASKFVSLDTDKFGSIKKEWLNFPETTPDL